MIFTTEEARRATKPVAEDRLLRSREAVRARIEITIEQAIAEGLFECFVEIGDCRAAAREEIETFERLGYMIGLTETQIYVCWDSEKQRRLPRPK